MVEKELQPPERGLPAAIQERNKMRGAQQPMALYRSEDLKIAGRKSHAGDRGALEARSAELVSHRPTLPADLLLGKAPPPAA